MTVDTRIFRPSMADSFGCAALLTTPLMFVGVIGLLTADHFYPLPWFLAPLAVMPALSAAIYHLAAVRVSNDGVQNRCGRLIRWSAVERITKSPWLGVVVVHGDALTLVGPSIAKKPEFRDRMRGLLAQGASARPVDGLNLVSEQRVFTWSGPDKIWAAGLWLLLVVAICAVVYTSSYLVFGDTDFYGIGALPILMFMMASTVRTNRQVIVSAHGIEYASGMGLGWSEIKKVRSVRFLLRGMLVTDDGYARLTIPHSIAADPSFLETVRTFAGAQNPLVSALTWKSFRGSEPDAQDVPRRRE